MDGGEHRPDCYNNLQCPPIGKTQLTVHSSGLLILPVNSAPLWSTLVPDYSSSAVEEVSPSVGRNSTHHAASVSVSVADGKKLKFNSFAKFSQSYKRLMAGIRICV